MPSLSSPDVVAKLQALGIQFQEIPKPTANYCMCVRSGNLLHLCGHNPTREDGTLVKGTFGKNLSVEEGYEAAKLCGIQLLNTISNELQGDWSRLVRIVKVVGFVHCTDDFEQQPNVINGASDLFVEVLGRPQGVHARSAVGMNALPWGIATEVECIVEIRD
jgi:enamine deaminase RidA (YjgF/YER057c/UK114 family)